MYISIMSSCTVPYICIHDVTYICSFAMLNLAFKIILLNHFMHRFLSPRWPYPVPMHFMYILHLLVDIINVLFVVFDIHIEFGIGGSNVHVVKKRLLHTCRLLVSPWLYLFLEPLCVVEVEDAVLHD